MQHLPIVTVAPSLTDTDTCTHCTQAFASTDEDIGEILRINFIHCSIQLRKNIKSYSPKKATTRNAKHFRRLYACISGCAQCNLIRFNGSTECNLLPFMCTKTQLMRFKLFSAFLFLKLCVPSCRCKRCSGSGWLPDHWMDAAIKMRMGSDLVNDINKMYRSVWQIVVIKQQTLMWQMGRLAWSDQTSCAFFSMEQWNKRREYSVRRNLIASIVVLHFLYFYVFHFISFHSISMWFDSVVSNRMICGCFVCTFRISLHWNVPGNIDGIR